jgi:fatty acid desaturase
MSDRPWVNQLFGYYSMSGLSNPAMLEQHHNYGHHSFTNDYMRVCEQPWTKHKRYWLSGLEGGAVCERDQKRWPLEEAPLED